MNCAIVSKKPIKIAVPITGLFKVDINDENLNVLLFFNLDSLLVLLVSFKRNEAHKVPVSAIPAAKKKGTCGPNLLSKPPVAGPITKPKAEPNKPNFFTRTSGVEVSDIIACATETLPPVKPSNILAAKSRSKLRAYAKNKNGDTGTCQGENQ